MDYFELAKDLVRMQMEELRALSFHAWVEENERMSSVERINFERHVNLRGRAWLVRVHVDSCGGVDEIVELFSEEENQPMSTDNLKGTEIEYLIERMQEEYDEYDKACREESKPARFPRFREDCLPENQEGE